MDCKGEATGEPIYFKIRCLWGIPDLTIHLCARRKLVMGRDGQMIVLSIDFVFAYLSSCSQRCCPPVARTYGTSGLSCVVPRTGCSSLSKHCRYSSWQICASQGHGAGQVHVLRLTKWFVRSMSCLQLEFLIWSKSRSWARIEALPPLACRKTTLSPHDDPLPFSPLKAFTRYRTTYEPPARATVLSPVP